MKEDLIERIYIQVYFWLLLIVQTSMVATTQELDTFKGLINTIFIYLSLIPLYGYAYAKQTASQTLWKLFVPAFLIWEAACFLYLYPNTMSINLLLLIMMAPLYWSLINYALITMEQDEKKQAERAEKRQRIKEKFRSVVVISSSLALLLMILSIVVMARYF
ncbi:MAG: hypothetical protein R6U50_15400 [Desulfobacterales bacterium]